MTALVVANTVLIAALLVLVAGLLRAHAEMLRNLAVVNRSTRGMHEKFAAGLPLPPNRDHMTEAVAISGETLNGQRAHLAFEAGGKNTLLAFLSSSCMTCLGFWEQFQSSHRPAMPGDAQLIIVTKDARYESPSKLADLAPDDVAVLMSSAAWEAYGVPAAPYFVYIGGVSGLVHGEGAAVSWPQVESLLTDALYEAEGGAEDGAPRGESTAERNRRADEALAAAGVKFDDPTLWSSEDLRP
jgi:hypothetical protein